ncbi:hypothetical protein AGDE_05299 [Angomonas deanei]|uniref:Prefoldin subunit, putative n=1 Tax=Angomonas deanei TaxID=59799 RepID=A0A7G2CFA6_9TRYP|nr:hypothetical protein AGDE_05299 [Angomonas deanei]CAD2218219.1 Prefoldin subunit, putative [Angomonas deanei]|eukprot:EPY38630.1 hypothetical protein AGDE_05299 [Angomonas deanei]
MSKEDNQAAVMELQEKQRAYQEQQQTVDNLLGTIRRIANRQIQSRTEARRATLTLAELTQLQPTHKVYYGVGRVYMSTTVNDMIAEQSAIKERNEAEEEKLKAEKQRATEMAEQEKKELARLESEYAVLANTVRNMFMQMQQQQQQQKKN